MVEKAGGAAGHRTLRQAAAALGALLQDAEAALEAGETEAAERQAKAISALVRAPRRRRL